MYYKVINKESEVYKKLREQREKEMEADKRNKAKIEELLGFKWKAFYGRNGYQNLWRVTTYTAFVPEDGSNITNVVRPSSKSEDAYEPNRRSKAGKALSDFLRRGMETFHFDQVLNIVGVKRYLSRFNIPFMAIKDDVVLLYLDEDHRPTAEDVVEITFKEFEELLKEEEEQ